MGLRGLLVDIYVYYSALRARKVYKIRLNFFSGKTGQIIRFWFVSDQSSIFSPTSEFFESCLLSSVLPHFANFKMQLNISVIQKTITNSGPANE